MAKKEIIAFDPPIEEEIMLIQPNNVTFGQYNVSEWQENLLTLIGDKIQKHMGRKQKSRRRHTASQSLRFLTDSFQPCNPFIHCL